MMPALCSDAEHDLLGRQLGEPLWPDWQSLEDLERIRRTVGEREWMCLYQQTPTASGGNLFDISKLTTQDSAPQYGTADIVRAWDVAATAPSDTRNPDHTVGVLMARMAEGRFVILDVIQTRGDPARLAGCRRPERVATGRSSHCGMGRVMHHDTEWPPLAKFHSTPHRRKKHTEEALRFECRDVSILAKAVTLRRMGHHVALDAFHRKLNA